MIKTFKLLARLAILLIFILFILATSLCILQREGNLVIKNQNRTATHSARIKLPYLIKFASIIEREGYYKAWVNQIIDPDYSNSENRVNKIFDWVVSLKTTPVIELGNVEQHAYYAIVKQYGELYEKVEVFCNLIAVAGYQASKI